MKFIHCAFQVYEETSIDIEAKLVKDRYIEETFSEQLARFYIITDVPMESKCSPRLRMEIKVVWCVYTFYFL